jgi:hypothetical protein
LNYIWVKEKQRRVTKIKAELPTKVEKKRNILKKE